MNVCRQISKVGKDNNTVLSIGTFDGVHQAHRQIIQRVKEIARDRKLRSLIITFDPHPQEVLRTKIPDLKILSTTDEKISMMEELEVQNVLIINFTLEFSKTSAHDFYSDLICGKIGLSDIVVGYDHGFGHDREGNLKMLEELGKEFDFKVHKVAEMDFDGAPVSSTRIRKHLREGEIEKANSLLGYDYSFEGIVVKGDRVGKSLGYPTANLKPAAENKVLPKDGVYCVKVEYQKQNYFGMMNIGFRPTLTDGTKKVNEVNIFDFDKNIYGEKIKVSFSKLLRDEKKFSGKQELIQQLHKDREESLKEFSLHFSNHA